MPHSTFLVFLLALAAGMTSLAWAAQRPRHHFSPATEALVAPMLHYNLWILVWLGVSYADATLVPQLAPAQGHGLLAGLLWISQVAALRWSAAFLAFTRRAGAGAPVSSPRWPWAAAGTGALTLAFLVLGHFSWVRTINRCLVSVVFLAVAVASLSFTRRVRRSEPEGGRLAILGTAYSILFMAQTAFIWWGRLDPRLPRSLFVVVNLTAEIAYNLVTVLWIAILDRPLPGSRPEAAGPGPATGLPISKREQEVADLVCRGLTNQEIADALCISLKTVKDHNYRIFQKTGVRNRVELAQLVRAGQPAPPPPART